MAIHALICDIGDVLLLRSGESLEAQWERRLRLPRGTVLARLFESGIVEQAYTGRMSDQEVTQALGTLLGLTSDQSSEFARQREEESRYVLNEPLVTYLNSLHPTSRLATLSNDWSRGRTYNERHYALSEKRGADAMLYSYEEGCMKPDASFYLLACERLDIAPHGALFIDNLEECIEGARNAGMSGVQFVSTAQTIADLQGVLRGT